LHAAMARRRQHDQGRSDAFAAHIGATEQSRNAPRASE
jgi:hypothetical protein